MDKVLSYTQCFEDTRRLLVGSTMFRDDFVLIQLLSKDI